MRVKSVLAQSVVALAALTPLIAASPAAAADLSSPVGLWQAVDDSTKQPTGWFIISNHDGVYSGIIAKMFMKPGEDPNPSATNARMIAPIIPGSGSKSSAT